MYLRALGPYLPARVRFPQGMSRDSRLEAGIARRRAIPVPELAQGSWGLWPYLPTRVRI